MKRVRRLLYPLEGPRPALSPVLSASILTLTAAFLLTAWQEAAPQTPYEAWLKEDVAYIIDNQERAAYKALQTAPERKEFMRQFWLRRDPTPATERNEFKEEHYRRIAYANDHFPAPNLAGWKTDRGRFYIVYGPPDQIETHPAGGPAHNYPYEQWLYRHFEDRENVIIEFVDPDSDGKFFENPFVRLGPGVPLTRER